ncbi:MAG: M20 family metallopeptidase [Pirellulaceae bacterium]
MPLEVVETLCDLVSIPSVNPMGRDVSGDEYFEYALTDRLEQIFKDLRLPYERQQVEPRRDNIVARLEGDRTTGEKTPIIVFEAHQDTVPVEGMTIPPWTPEVRDGRVTGRGACDIKGGMACMLAALSRLADERPGGMPTIVMACSVNEEHGFGGAEAMGRLWANGKSSLVPRIPDAVLVAEPTELNIVVAHKGVARWQMHTLGRAVHSSMPEQGSNAIYGMARVLAALEDYAVNVVPQLKSHPLVGSPTLSVGLISGGISVNTVPDRCTIEIDRRVVPGENYLKAYEAVVEFLNQRCANTELEHDEPYIGADALSDARNGPLARHLQGLVRAKEGADRGQVVGVPYGTDAVVFDRIGAPTVVFGPGSIQQAHTCNEWIAIDQLQKATEIYYEFGKQGLPSEC